MSTSPATIKIPVDMTNQNNGLSSLGLWLGIATSVLGLISAVIAMPDILAFFEQWWETTALLFVGIILIVDHLRRRLARLEDGNLTGMAHKRLHEMEIQIKNQSNTLSKINDSYRAVQKQIKNLSTYMMETRDQITEGFKTSQTLLPKGEHDAGQKQTDEGDSAS